MGLEKGMEANEENLVEKLREMQEKIDQDKGLSRKYDKNQFKVTVFKNSYIIYPIKDAVYKWLESDDDRSIAPLGFRD
jgi:hypothetical protein